MKKNQDVSALNRSRRQALAYLGAVSLAGLLPGCGGGSGAGSVSTTPGGSGAAASNPQPAASGPVTDAGVTVAMAAAGSITSNFIGLSYEKGQMANSFFSPSNADAIGMFQRLGTSLVRIGGNSVDKTTWMPDGAGRTSGQVAPSDIDALAGFLQATGWSVLYGVNLAQSTPALAAAEVAYAVKSLGSSLHGIEIGNEPDLYAGNYFASTWSFSDYLTLWQSFAAAIAQQTPPVKLTGPVAAYNVSGYVQPFAAAEGKDIELLSVHYYRANGQLATSTVDYLISYPDTSLKTMLSGMLAISSSSGVPFRVAETNSFYNGGATGVSDSYASALWVIDHAMTCALGGATGINLHGGGNGGGYTPIADSGGTVVGARPEFYGLALLNLAGTGQLQPAAVAAGTLNVSAYAIATASGYSVVVVNKDATQNLALSLAMPSAVSSATLLAMQGPALASTDTPTIQGAAIGIDGSLSLAAPYTLPVSGQTVSATVPPAAAVLIQVR